MQSASQLIATAERVTQENRLLAVSTELGEDVLLLSSISGSEAVSRPFHFKLDLLTDVFNQEPPKVVPQDLVGTPMTVSIRLYDSETGSDFGERYINGLCEHFSCGDTDNYFQHFTAVIAPWFAFLRYRKNCRIFQNKTVPEIIQQIATELGYGAQLRLDLIKSYTAWDYCAQFRETDFNFLSRLMEAEGIYYYFEHRADTHVMVLADSPIYKPLPLQSSFDYSFEKGISPSLIQDDSIQHWSAEQRMYPAQWTMRDYHHETPLNPLSQTEQSPAAPAEAQRFEIFDFPGGFAKKFNRPAARLGQLVPEGERLDRLRIEERERFGATFHGTSKCRAFCPGYSITLTGGDATGSYWITNQKLKAVQWPTYRATEEIRTPYQNKFHMIRSEVPYVPPQRTRKPVVHGLQTAFVIDESRSGNSEEIWPDEYGRVRVRFHWDREAQYACWLRVVQPWAGRIAGQQWIPRIGDEVAVVFQEGDPDVPYVIGSLYNKMNMPVFSLPRNKTQSGIRTHSSPGGGAADFNMLRFEDLNGAEEIFVQAQKDLNTLVKNNETRQVGNCRTSTIHVNDTRTVETGDDTISVKTANRSITVQQNITETSKAGNISTTANVGNISTTADEGNISTLASQGNISTTASQGNISTLASQGNISTTASQGDISTTASEGNISTFAMKNISTLADANISTAAQGNISTAAEGNIATTAVGNIRTTASSGNISTSASSGNVSVSAPSGQVSVSASEQVILHCGMAMIEMSPASILLNCGASVITLTPASITITAPMVLINP